MIIKSLQSLVLTSNASHVIAAAMITYAGLIFIAKFTDLCMIVVLLIQVVWVVTRLIDEIATTIFKLIRAFS